MKTPNAIAGSLHPVVDPVHGTRGLQPRRSRRVRCSAWQSKVHYSKISGPSLSAKAQCRPAMSLRRECNPGSRQIHEQKSAAPGARETSSPTNSTGGNRENRGPSPSPFSPLPPVQNARAAQSCRTSWITDPAPVTLGMHPRRNREVRCSRFVRLSIHALKSELLHHTPLAMTCGARQDACRVISTKAHREDKCVVRRDTNAPPQQHQGAR